MSNNNLRDIFHNKKKSELEKLFAHWILLGGQTDAIRISLWDCMCLKFECRKKKLSIVSKRKAFIFKYAM